MHARAIILALAMSLASTGYLMAGPQDAPMHKDAIAVWTDPDAADAKLRKVEEGDAFYYQRPFALTQQHIDLLRKARFVWDTVERGAPAVDPKKPYGRADLVAQLEETFGDEKPGQLAMRQIEMAVALRTLLRHGTLEPGSYASRSGGLKDARDVAAEISKGFGQPDGVNVFTNDDGFQFTQEHRALLKALTVDWSGRWQDVEDTVDFGGFPAASGDGKRPYGDRSYIEFDMFEALDGKLKMGPDFEFEDLPPGEEKRLGVLHAQMLGAIQVFVEHAAIAPGSYE
jgi:hypothetical protein